MRSLDDHLQERSERTASLARDGFRVLKEFLRPSEMEEIKGFVETAMRLPNDSTCTRPRSTLTPLRWNDAIVQRVLLSEHRLGRLRNGALGDDLKWISGYIGSKEPFSPPRWWHQDWWCWDHPVRFRAHLIDHPALPLTSEAAQATAALPNLLPTFEGERRSLGLNRNAPAKIKVAGAVVAGTGG
jgi:hypothetical protein